MSTSTAYTSERASELKDNLQAILSEIEAVPPPSSSGTVAGSTSGPRARARLVAVSKIKPASDIQALYDSGHRHFGENYIQELVDKAEILPKDINWHFIGSLQSNKAKALAAIPNLYLLETLSSTKVASLLQKSLSPERSSPLNVYIQINTSGEDSKSGLPPLKKDSSKSEGEEPVLELAKYVLDECPGLSLAGLMTIGSFEASHDDTDGKNPDFETLKETRAELARVLDGRVKEQDLELSMGMSADFIQAIQAGSSSVRVGTRIFGERPKKN